MVRHYDFRIKWQAAFGRVSVPEPRAWECVLRKFSFDRTSA